MSEELAIAMIVIALINFAYHIPNLLKARRERKIQLPILGSFAESSSYNAFYLLYCLTIVALIFACTLLSVGLLVLVVQ